MSGKAKRLLAILAALGITASGVVDFLNHVMSAFPNPKLHMICSGIITAIGLAVAVFPVSVKNPNPVDLDKTPAESPSARTKQSGKVDALLLVALGLLVVGAIAFMSGCATSATPKGATLAQKVKDDGAAAQQIALDVEQKCGSKFKSLAPVLADMLAVAKDPTNVIGDIIAAIDAYAPLQADAAATMCVLKTVVADIKALQPAKTAQLDRLVAQIEVGQSL